MVVTDLSWQEQASTLERTVNERTAQLREKVGELEAFSYSISHDMRQPLRAMQGYSQILIEDHADKLDQEARNYLERIKRSSQRLDRLIQDVLTYSRAIRGEDKASTINLATVIHHVLENYLDFAKAKIEIDLTAVWVRGHEAALTQCISNLLSNAIKFIPNDKKPEIRICSESRGKNVRLWVIDNGIGIDMNDHERIFGIFSRVHREELFEGTGIGLSIVKNRSKKCADGWAWNRNWEKAAGFGLNCKVAKRP